MYFTSTHKYFHSFLIYFLLHVRKIKAHKLVFVPLFVAVLSLSLSLSLTLSLALVTILCRLSRLSWSKPRVMTSQLAPRAVLGGLNSSLQLLWILSYSIFIDINWQLLTVNQCTLGYKHLLAHVGRSTPSVLFILPTAFLVTGNITNSTFHKGILP